MTNARRAEIFTATAAYVKLALVEMDIANSKNRYAAVLVVFVSGNISNSQNVPSPGQ